VVRHDAVHTLELEAGNHTTDSYINELSVTEQRIVISKDADFVNSFLLAGAPLSYCWNQQEILVIRSF